MSLASIAELVRLTTPMRFVGSNPMKGPIAAGPTRMEDDACAVRRTENLPAKGGRRQDCPERLAGGVHIRGQILEHVVDR